MKTKIKSCICYVVDDNYLFPTLVSASQARQHFKSELNDIIIVCLAEPSGKTDTASEIASSLGLILLVRPLSVIDKMHPMYGRLFIHSLIPASYERVIYMDGDTQIVGSLEPLIKTDIPTGKFLAVRDPAGIFARSSDAWMRATQADRHRAGITRSYDDYFNTGVLVFNRPDWKALSELTLGAIRRKEEGFKFGDQDPMNAVVGDQCIFIPNTWNFPGFFIGTPSEILARPIVYHFMSNPRPWTHSGRPWGPEWSNPYKRFMQTYPASATLAPKASTVQKLKYQFQQLVKCGTEYRKVGRLHETPADIII